MVERIDELWDFSNPSESESRFLSAADSESDPMNRAELLTQAARSMGLQKKFDDASALLNGVSQSLPAGDSIAKVRYHLESGRVLNSSRTGDRGLEHFLEASEMAARLDDNHLEIDAIHMLAIIGTPEQALALNLQAIDKAKRTTQPRARKWIGSLSNNLGWTYFDQGELRLALDQFQIAHEYFLSTGNDASKAIAKWTLGRVYRELGQHSLAIQMQRRVLELAPDDGYCHEELALLNRLTGDPKKARYYAEKALPFIRENHPDELNRIQSLEKILV
ncbi:MAG: tetratricopeptide repeat protein [Armatimonadetes bacterium]|nr:tetratricopeptide repeat protein [Armatimonadota bacterium]